MHHQQNPHRREFLAATGVATAACVAGVSSAAEQSSDSPRSLYNLTSEQASQLIGQRFHVDASHPSRQSATLVLKQVIAHQQDQQRPAGVRAQGFSLIFSEVNEARLANDTYRVSGGGLPACDLLLNDAAPARAKQRCYEVVIN